MSYQDSYCCAYELFHISSVSHNTTFVFTSNREPWKLRLGAVRSAHVPTADFVRTVLTSSLSSVSSDFSLSNTRLHSPSHPPSDRAITHTRLSCVLLAAAAAAAQLRHERLRLPPGYRSSSGPERSLRRAFTSARQPCTRSRNFPVLVDGSRASLSH